MKFATMFLTALSLGKDLMVRALDDLAAHRIERRPQRRVSCSGRARNISPDEKLIDLTKWPIERAWHVMQGTPLWLDPIPLPEALVRKNLVDLYVLFQIGEIRRRKMWNKGQ